MEENLHSPTPWHLHPSGLPNSLGDFTVFHGEGERKDNQVCQARKDDAELIVNAVNACMAPGGRKGGLPLILLTDANKHDDRRGILIRADHISAVFDAIQTRTTNAPTLVYTVGGNCLPVREPAEEVWRMIEDAIVLQGEMR